MIYLVISCLPFWFFFFFGKGIDGLLTISIDLPDSKLRKQNKIVQICH